MISDLRLDQISRFVHVIKAGNFLNGMAPFQNFFLRVNFVKIGRYDQMLGGRTCGDTEDYQRRGNNNPT